MRILGTLGVAASNYTLQSFVSTTSIAAAARAKHVDQQLSSSLSSSPPYTRPGSGVFADSAIPCTPASVNMLRKLPPESAVLIVVAITRNASAGLA